MRGNHQKIFGSVCIKFIGFFFLKTGAFQKVPVFFSMNFILSEDQEFFFQDKFNGI